MGGPLLRGSDRKTLRRFGGKLQTANCRSRCCAGGDCTQLRKYLRCAATPDIDGCQTLPMHLWLCERTDPPMPQTIKQANSCYSRTDTVIETVDIPSGDVLILGIMPDISGGCSSPECTICGQYYLAEPCPGQNVGGTPPVFVLVDRVPTPGPGEDCGGFVVQWPTNGRICYSVKPGEMYNEARVDELGGYKVLDGVLPPGFFKCCLCVTGCDEHVVADYFDCGIGQRTINLRCCCSDEWTKTVQVQSTIIVSQITATESIIETEHYGGSETITNTTSPWPTLPWYKRRTEGGVETYYETGERPLPDGGHCAPFMLPPAPGFCPGGGPFTRTDGLGNTEEVVRADTYRTCNSLDISYQYRFWASDQPGTPRIDHTFTISIRVRHTGRCGGGCGQSAGQAADPAGRVVAALQAKRVEAVPRKDWPLWAAAVALGKADSDTGIGDTIKRTLGASGEVFEAWYKRVVGKDCGCRDRAAFLNQRYPYQ